ncbi:hypothetical protein P7K49_024879 [Saguinus oedipus]|uniref:Uncharacterized protein n=1 Tax=Saguinus oedipus TaxID=9490 RepID=A0ABQ9UGE2_SAGOE|nr:hypothetical protein P7K49_024879 [Saguinus oedipus]
MSIQGSANLQTQWNIVGEFSNLPQEELIEWIKYSTKPDAVFAGAMPTMASVKLSALRPIVNHPHYEDAGLRSVHNFQGLTPSNGEPHFGEVRQLSTRGRIIHTVSLCYTASYGWSRETLRNSDED